MTSRVREVCEIMRESRNDLEVSRAEDVHQLRTAISEMIDRELEFVFKVVTVAYTSKPSLTSSVPSHPTSGIRVEYMDDDDAHDRTQEIEPHNPVKTQTQ